VCRGDLPSCPRRGAPRASAPRDRGATAAARPPCRP